MSNIPLLLPSEVTPNAPVSGCDLAAMAAAIESTLPNTAIIERNVETMDGDNFPTEDWQAVAQGESYIVRCRVTAQVKASELLQGDKPTTRSGYVLTLPAGVDVEDKDRVQVLETAQTYVVTRHTKGASGSPRTLAYCERVN